LWTFKDTSDLFSAVRTNFRIQLCSAVGTVFVVAVFDLCATVRASV